MLKRMQTNPERYPSGMAYLGEYLHKNDLKFGLYSDAGYKTCGGMAASLGYEAIDLDQGTSINYVSKTWEGMEIQCFPRLGTKMSP